MPNISPKYFDLRKDPQDIRDYKFTTSLNFRTEKELEDSLPTKIDHSHLMSSVKDQGNLGSCVAFATASMKEWQEQDEHNKEVKAGKNDLREGEEYDLSEAWIYWMSKKIDPWPNEEGTSIRYAMQVLQKIGAPCEQGWPYVDDPEKRGKPEHWAHLIARWFVISTYYRVTTLSEIKAALLQGPLVAGIGVYEEIFDVKEDGKIPDPKDPNYCYGGHAVCLCGFNDEDKTIKFKNSWGKSWGENGYGFISYYYARRYLWDAWVAKDVSVLPEMLCGTRKILEVIK